MNDYIIMEDGRKIEIDDTPYVIKDGTLYVYGPCWNGYKYMEVGKVKAVVEEGENNA